MASLWIYICHVIKNKQKNILNAGYEKQLLSFLATNTNYNKNRSAYNMQFLFTRVWLQPTGAHCP
jgi:hypothetical protein